LEFACNCNSTSRKWYTRFKATFIKCVIRGKVIDRAIDIYGGNTAVLPCTGRWSIRVPIATAAFRHKVLSKA
jgi:hypothetical protein